MTAVTPLTRAEVRAAVKATVGYGNTVRPPVHANMLGSERGMVLAGELAGAFLTVALYVGQASDGYKTDYLPVRRWWTLLTVGDESGHVVWSMGTRWANKAKAEADFHESAASIREGR